MSNWLIKQQLREAEERAKIGEPTQEDYGDYLDQMDKEATEARAELTYTIEADETIWTVAKKLGFRPEELMEHNDIRPSEAVEGYVLHLPRPPREDKDGIEYETYHPARLMHVKKEGGARKFSFGNAKKWSDIRHSGSTYPRYTNVFIVAMAKVPIEDDMAAYFMDSQSFGDYESTGRVNFTLGFNWNDLEDGHVDKKEKEKEPEPVVIEHTIEENIVETLEEVEPQTVIKLNPNFYKSTYKQFSEPMTYIVNSNDPEKPALSVHEMDGRRMPVEVKNGKGVVIAGFFEKDDRLYGRPKDSIPNGYWFGIPVENMILEDEMYNTAMDLPMKVAAHKRLTPSEKWHIGVAYTLSQYTWLANKINKKLKKDKEQ